ncbi:4Fe-4S dicluster domain-containing protein [candidate division KSB1 bacterium]
MRIKISKNIVKSDFVKKVEVLSNQDLLLCFQCGKCTAGCPMAEHMDLKPNQVIRSCQLGLEDEVLKSKTIWYCASCFQCYSRCPKGIDLSCINETLRFIAMGTDYDYFGPDHISRETIDEAPQQAMVSLLRKFSL